MTRETKAQVVTREKAEAKELLINMLASAVRPEILCILRHVSRSGMQRVIDLAFVAKINDQGETDLCRIGYKAAKVLGWRYSDKHDGVIVDGAGMDMGFHLVYSLSAALYGHENEGGYKIKHRWL
jgi:hypothetical protein